MCVCICLSVHISLAGCCFFSLLIHKHTHTHSLSHTHTHTQPLLSSPKPANPPHLLISPKVLGTLTPHRYALLLHLMSFVSRLSKKAEVTRMTVDNLATVIGPNVFQYVHYSCRLCVCVCACLFESGLT